MTEEKEKKPGFLSTLWSKTKEKAPAVKDVAKGAGIDDDLLKPFGGLQRTCLMQHG